MTANGAYRAAVDIGGTFTDCVVIDADDNVTIAKSPSTREDPAQGVLNALTAAAEMRGMSRRQLASSLSKFVHGNTIGTNALIERTGARSGLLTTIGHEDNILIGRMFSKRAGLSEREMTHTSRLNKPAPLVPRERIVGIPERLDFEGDVLLALDEEAVLDGVERLVEQESIEALAICFLWSFRNPVHERRAAELIRERHPSLPVTLSSEVAPVVGEYERIVTTVLNAYLSPRVSTYLEELQDTLRGDGFQHDLMVVQSSGGVARVDLAARKPVLTIDSGPAGGTLGSRYFGDLIDEPNLICTDVGGTSFDVSIVYDGKVQLETEPVIGQYVYRAPKILIKSIGAGGGSIVWLDDDGIMHVGPRSAGASPGPASYGNGGTEPTVTDADLLLGFINPENFLGGRMRLDVAKAEVALEPIAKRLGLSVLDTAYGVFRITNAHMADLIRTMSIGQGYDPRDFAVVAYGGAGAVHAIGYTADIDAKALYVPREATVFSALGMLCADVTHSEEVSRPMRTPLDAGAYEEISEIFRRLTDEVIESLRREGVAAEQVQLRRSIFMRYQAQVHELEVDVPLRDLTGADEETLGKLFYDSYTAVFGEGAAFAAGGHEYLTFRVVGAATSEKPAFRASGGAHESSQGELGTRQMYFGTDGGLVDGHVYDGTHLSPGDTLRGPAVIERYGDSVVVPPGFGLRIDAFENIVITMREGER